MFPVEKMKKMTQNQENYWELLEKQDDMMSKFLVWLHKINKKRKKNDKKSKM